MKKVLIAIVVILLIVGIIVAVKFTNKEQVDLDSIIDEEMTQSTDYKGKKADEWESIIMEYLSDGKGIMVKDVDCYYSKAKNFVAIVNYQNDDKDQFVFDKDTGIARNKVSGLEIDFLNSKIVNTIKGIGEYFKDNICLAIASITEENEEKTIEKYFASEETYIQTRLRDYSNNTEYVDKFLIVPKNEDVKYDICKCTINEEGEVVVEKVLSEGNNDTIIFCCDDYESTMPQYGIRFKYNGFEDLLPLSFSGYDGSFNIYGHENEVVDLTIYE